MMAADMTIPIDWGTIFAQAQAFISDNSTLLAGVLAISVGLWIFERIVQAIRSGKPSE